MKIWRGQRSRKSSDDCFFNAHFSRGTTQRPSFLSEDTLAKERRPLARGASHDQENKRTSSVCLRLLFDWRRRWTATAGLRDRPVTLSRYADPDRRSILRWV